MVAQHGTLNIVDGSVFMVLSLPVSAFSGVDDNDDGSVTMMEFNNHRAAIVASVKDNVVLSDAKERLFIQGIILSPVAQDDTAVASISQITIMGRFVLNDTVSALRFEVGLYGSDVAEKTLEIAATRSHDRRKDVFELTPAEPASFLFPLSL